METEQKKGFNLFMQNVNKLVKHTLKVLQCEHHKIFKVCSFFNIMYEKVNLFFG